MLKFVCNLIIRFKDTTFLFKFPFVFPKSFPLLAQRQRHWTRTKLKDKESESCASKIFSCPTSLHCSSHLFVDFRPVREGSPKKTGNSTLRQAWQLWPYFSERCPLWSFFLRLNSIVNLLIHSLQAHKQDQKEEVCLDVLYLTGW